MIKIQRSVLTVKRIYVGSATQVGAWVGALLWSVFGLLFVLSEFILVSSTQSGSSQEAPDFFLFILLYLGGFVAAAISGAVSLGLTAYFYNYVSARWVRLEFDIELIER